MPPTNILTEVPSLLSSVAGPRIQYEVTENQFIASAVAEKVGSLRTAAEFLRERAGAANPADMLKYLRRRRNRPPSPVMTADRNL